jgi:hypothetical protein
MIWKDVISSDDLRGDRISYWKRQDIVNLDVRGL